MWARKASARCWRGRDPESGQGGMGSQDELRTVCAKLSGAARSLFAQKAGCREACQSLCRTTSA